MTEFVSGWLAAYRHYIGIPHEDEQYFAAAEEAIGACPTPTDADIDVRITRTKITIKIKGDNTQ